MVELGDAVPQTPWDLSLFELLQQKDGPGDLGDHPALLLFAALQSALGLRPPQSPILR